jgi:NO-binding membrane sensor protein with MHYT domain
VIGIYDPWLILLSMAVSVMASYVALDLARRIGWHHFPLENRRR